MSEFDYSAQELKPGKTITIKFESLPGKPEVDIEHLGDENATWVAEKILKANAPDKRTIGGGKRKVTKASLAENDERVREVLAKHVVRHLRATKKDGTKVGDEKIATWCAEIPQHMADSLFVTASDASYFVDMPEGDVEDTAEK